MTSKQFTVVHLSSATGKAESKTVTADGFYVQHDTVIFTDNDNKAVAAFPLAQIDSIQSQAAPELKNA